MATVIVVNPNRTEPLVRLKAELADPRRALERIGAILEAGAIDAFAEQRFGSFSWPERYPNQSEPFINVAGALSDFASGRSEPKSRRFDRRPAVRDTSTLMQSIASDVVSRDTVEVGSVVPYAGDHQWGLVSSQPVTPDTKKRVAQWLLRPAGKPYREKMLPLLKPNLTTWDTEIVQRPFLGVHEQMEDDISGQVAELIAEAAVGGDS